MPTVTSVEEGQPSPPTVLPVESPVEIENVQNAQSAFNPKNYIMLALVVIISLAFLVGFGLARIQNDGAVATKATSSSATAAQTQAPSSAPVDDTTTAPSATESSPSATCDEDFKTEIRAAVTVLCRSYIELVCHQIREGIVGGVDDDATYDVADDDAAYNTTDDDSIWSLRSINVRPKPTSSGQRLSFQAKSASRISSNPWGPNNQRVGVQEADMVQSNGTHVFLAHEGRIVIVKASTTTIASRTEIDGAGAYNEVVGLLLAGDNSLIVILNKEQNEVEGFFVSGTTVLIYSMADMILQQKESLPGSYVGARVVGNTVRVATAQILGDLNGLEEKLMSSYIQNLTTTALDEETYRGMAQEQLDLHLDAFVAKLADDLDCTGLTVVPALKYTNDTSTTMSAKWSTLATITSIDVSSSSIHSRSTTNVLLPNYFETFYASEERIVLICDATVSGDSSMNFDSSPFATYLVALKDSNASIVATSPAIVPGVVSTPTMMEHFARDGSDYFRVVSTSSEDVGYDGEQVPTSWRVSVFEMLDDSETGMPMVGELFADLPGYRVESALFLGDSMFAAASATNGTSLLCTVNMTELANLQSEERLAIPGSVLRLQALDEHFILVPGFAHVNAKSQFQLSLLNVSNTNRPSLVQQWKNQPPYNSCVFETVASDYEFDEMAFRFDSASKTLVLPISKTLSMLTPCDDSAIANEHSLTLTNQSITLYNKTCPCSNTLVDFDGFVVFKIENGTKGITEHFSIEHPAPHFRGKHCSSYDGTPRSFIFDNEVMTVSRGSVMKHDLQTKAETASVLDLGISSCKRF